MDPIDLTRHLFALRSSGYTRVEGCVTGEWLDELGTLSNRALAAVRAALARGEKLHGTYASDESIACRCLYVWGEAALRLIDLPEVHAIAGAMMGTYRLWDLSLLASLPTQAKHAEEALSWHRDTAPVDTRTVPPPFLWFFICLDATTPKNGATWFVPGSHHFVLPEGLRNRGAIPRPFPTCTQLLGNAGDLLVIDPTALHSVGANRTGHPRRLVNVAISTEATPPLLDHWAIAGPNIQPRVTPTQQRMLRCGFPGLERTWTVLPPGWVTA
ncbi:MAG: phytanoyl-CoA dioxygenase family protein [Planctomycetota bacterium]|nr:phytanoyl-CoA dioxygenase family protein [Planctomycetota bacterium]